MASVSYQCDGLFHCVFQPHTAPETQYPPPRFVQIELTISLDLLLIRHDCLTGRFTEAGTDFSQETLRFNLHVLKFPNQARHIIAAMLSRLRIRPTSLTSDILIDKIIRTGLRIANWESNIGRKVLPLHAELWGMVVKHVNDERALIRRALAESASQTNHGMVPAKESSVKRMLKRVGAEEDKDQNEKVKESNKKRKVKGEDCVICLEEIKVGSEASQMPCSHTFHGDCIEKWLKQSHYCPICRFEMPI